MASFVYCWTDHETEKLYIGYHKGSPNDGYICSSKHMLAAYKKRPHTFTRQIIATGNETDMMNFETTLLKALKVKDDPKFYNLSENNPPAYGNKKKNRIPWNKGLKGAQVPWNKGMYGEQHHRYGKPSGMFGKTQSAKQKELAKQWTMENNPMHRQMNCPHCNFVGPKNRWHWDNCKEKGGF